MVLDETIFLGIYYFFNISIFLLTFIIIFYSYSISSTQAVDP